MERANIHDNNVDDDGVCTESGLRQVLVNANAARLAAAASAGGCAVAHEDDVATPLSHRLCTHVA